MSKLEMTINSIIKDLDFGDYSKEEFLAECACKRINDKNKKYEESFDHYLKLIESNEGNSKDLVRFGKTLTSLSDLVTLSYDGLIKMISNCEKNIFKKD